MIPWPYLKAVILFYVIRTCTCKLEQTLICEDELPISNYEDKPVARQQQLQVHLPTMRDLVLYLRSLHSIVKYSNTHPKEIDLNLAFGLIQINVNLKNERMFPNRHVEPLMRKRMTQIVDLNDQVIKGFVKNVTMNKTSLNKLDKLMLTLFLNETMWMERMVQFDSRRPNVKRTSSNTLKSIYKSWDIYMVNVNKAEPNETVSDNCQAALSHNSVILLQADPICELPDICRKVLRNGSNIGYGLTHRILLMLTARLGRGCIMFSKKEDKRLMDQLCAHSYVESEYIALNKFVAMDLLMEHISLCALAGHVKFIRRTWVNFVLLHQLPIGCFNIDAGLVKEHRFEALLTDHKNVSHDHCHIHLTATSALALAITARYVISSSRSPAEKRASRIIEESLDHIDYNIASQHYDY